MTGQSHLCMTVCTGINTVCGLLIYDEMKLVHPALEHPIPNAVSDFVFSGSFFPPLWWVTAIILYLIGGIMPDIDTKHSMASKLMFGAVFPGEHRTWTHSIWAIAVLAAVSYTLPVCVFFLAGYLLHIILDSVSNGGVCFFYPIQKYRKYGKGAKVKIGHKWRLYSSGGPGEYFIDGFTVCLTFGMIFLTVLQLTYIRI